MTTAVATLLPGQATFFFLYAWSLGLWLISEYLHYRSRYSHDYDGISDVELQGKDKGIEVTADAAGSGATGRLASPTHGTANGISNGESHEGEMVTKWTGALKSASSCSLVRCMMFDLEAIKQEKATLKAMAEFGTLLFWYFLCDRTPLMAAGDKSYSRDLFLFLFLILTCVAFGSSLQTVKAPVLLSRQQTEEWKGWMQVLFLLYHYYEAKEAYNAIRIFIAAYVWMTGFGNFSYYYKTGDYCVGRFCQMMWRLNFLVFFTCLVMGNSYMLYYICPMHTIFTILVYACLGIAPQLNKNNILLAIKMLLCVACIYVCWDIKPVFNAIWSPFTWLVGYMDPRKENQEVLYEWYFRSSLDRFVWIYGMLCAWVHPLASSVISFIDNLPLIRRAMLRTCLLSVCGVVGYFWFIHVYCLPKQQYNAVHPYTSWIPITLFIVVRNLTPTLRLHHMRLYGWLGCITLETYIGQFHIWLKTSIVNGQPKALLNLLPGYPLINFAIVTAGYVFVSFRLFNLTNTLKNAAVPHSNDPMLLRNVLLLAATGAILYLACYGVLSLVI